MINKRINININNKMEEEYSKRFLRNKKRKIDDIDDDCEEEKSHSKINSFILTLYYICNDIENRDIVTFYDKGGIIIKNLELFTRIIQTKYKSNDYASFIRNLNIYGFVNITPKHRYDKRFFTNLNKNNFNKYYINKIIYANPYFLNNKNNLKKLCEIKCNSVHLHNNTFMKEIKELHNHEINEAVDLLLKLKNSKNI